MTGGGGGAVTGGDGGAQTTGSALRFEAASFSFDAVTVGAPATSHTFTVTNGGDEATAALAVSVTGDGFTVSGKTCMAALGAAGTCTIDVSFAPMTIGTRSGRLTVGDGVKASASVALLDSSLAPTTISVVGTTTDFGAVLVGTPVVKTFTVTNTGEAPAAMLASTFTGAQATAFEVVAPSGADCTAGINTVAGDGFVAWLSTPSLPLNSRWTVTGGLERVDGRAFAASRADVFAGRIVNPNDWTSSTGTGARRGSGWANAPSSAAASPLGAVARRPSIASSLESLLDAVVPVTRVAGRVGVALPEVSRRNRATVGSAAG